MKTDTIRSVHCIPMRLPFHHWTDPPLFAGRPRTKLDSALVRLETDDGLVAWGESYCVEPRALGAIFETLVAPLLVGKSASDPQLLPAIGRILHNLGRSGPVVHALAGVDIALWDMRAKRAGVPLYELLGGKRRDLVPAYASLLQYYGNASLLQKVTEQALREGYSEIKLHERTAPALAAVRQVAGPGVPIMVDTNCAWLPQEAPSAIAAMQENQPFWIEEPLWPPEDSEALEKLQAECGVPLAVGENASSAHSLLRLVEHRGVKYVQPSVIKLGLSAALEISRRCEGTGVICAPQVAFFGPGYLASIHLIAAQTEPVSLERLYVELAHTPYADTVPVVNGTVHVPQAPGLGADPDSRLAAGEFSD